MFWKTSHEILVLSCCWKVGRKKTPKTFLSIEFVSVALSSGGASIQCLGSRILGMNTCILLLHYCIK